jgi:hypothetical protein
VIFYHPYRGDDEEPGDDQGKWKSRLFSGRDWTDVQDELVFSPHFHAVVCAKHIDGGHVTKAVEEDTGWLVHRITKGESNVSIYDKYDLTRVTQYNLSHTGLYNTDETTRAAYRYFGRTANLSPTDRIEAEIDAAARSTAPKILGLPWSDLACQEDRGNRPPQSELVASTAAAEPGTGDGDGRFESNSSDAPDGKCAGRLLDITKAPAFLEDTEWCEKAPRSDELRDVWDKWREEVDGPPPD